jgi:hypothetical protein
MKRLAGTGEFSARHQAAGLGVALIKIHSTDPDATARGRCRRKARPLRPERASPSSSFASTRSVHPRSTVFRAAERGRVPWLCRLRGRQRRSGGLRGSRRTPPLACVNAPAPARSKPRTNLWRGQPVGTRHLPDRHRGSTGALHEDRSAGVSTSKATTKAAKPRPKSAAWMACPSSQRSLMSVQSAGRAPGVQAPRMIHGGDDDEPFCQPGAHTDCRCQSPIKSRPTVPNQEDEEPGCQDRRNFDGGADRCAKSDVEILLDGQPLSRSLPGISMT